MTKAPESMPALTVQWLGRDQAYSTIYEHMVQCLEQRVAQAIEDQLLLVEHQHTYTVGRHSGASTNVLMPGEVPVIEVSRGGDVTYHGNGQLTGYPILQLPEHKRDLHAYLHFLEQFWIDQLKKYDIHAERNSRNTGIWVNGKKIVALGIACRRWVVWHGFACNLSTDLSYFQRINPCGMSSELVTSMSEQSENPPSLAALVDDISMSFPLAYHAWINSSSISSK